MVGKCNAREQGGPRLSHLPRWRLKANLHGWALAPAVSNVGDRSAAAPFRLKLADPKRLGQPATAREEARADAVHSGNVGSRPAPVGQEGAAEVLDARRHRVSRGKLGAPGHAAAAQLPHCTEQGGAQGGLRRHSARLSGNRGQRVRGSRWLRMTPPTPCRQRGPAGQGGVRRGDRDNGKKTKKKLGAGPRIGPPPPPPCLRLGAPARCPSVQSRQGVKLAAGS